MKTILLSEIVAGGTLAILGLGNGGMVDVDGSVIPVRYKPGYETDMLVLAQTIRSLRSLTHFLMSSRSTVRHSPSKSSPDLPIPA